MISTIVSRFAENGPTVHITPIEVFTIGSFSITNSMLYGWISAFVICVTLITVAKMAKVYPRRGLIQLVEAGTDFIVNLVGSSLGSRQKALKYGPYFATIFFFVLLNNWLGLLPVVGESIRIGDTPLFRPFTADLNGTLAAAVVTMVLVQTFAIKESGFVKHVRHYFAGSLKNPATYLFGIFEIFTEFTRVISLALRLFLNVVIGEIIISVFAFLGKNASPLTSLPFVILELVVAGLQAYIFVMLSVTYLSVAIKHDHDDTHVADEINRSDESNEGVSITTGKRVNVA
jgi:F-type H+-transporting ATPase subunit a